MLLKFYSLESIFQYLGDYYEKIFGVFLLLLLLSPFSCKHSKDNSEGEVGKVELKLLKIDGISYPIQDEIKIDATEKDKLSVKYTKEPSDASINFEPNLVSGNWKLKNQLGEQTLKITVSKGKKVKNMCARLIKHQR